MTILFFQLFLPQNGYFWEHYPNQYCINQLMKEGILMGYNYRQLRRQSSDCHVFEFNPNDLRLDATIGVRGKLEKLSKIKGEPKSDEYTVAKINGGFFAMNGSTEFIGSFVDEGLYYQGSSYYYPTLVYWKENNKMTVEYRPNQDRHAFYQKNAWWAIGVPWTLVVDGKANYTYDKKTLIDQFGHPYTRNPRTLMGQKADGTIVWVVVDGRRTSSKGFTILHSSDLMLELGCKIAVNLDGGGSSEMIVNDKIVNKCSGGGERSIGTAFMAYGKRATISDQDYSATGIVYGATTVNVRSGDSTKYSKIGTVKKNQTLAIVSKSSSTGWYRIVFGSGYGWISNYYVKIVDNTASSQNTGVTTTALNMRTGPGTSYARVLTIPKGKTVSIEGQTNGWYKVTYNGKSGYSSGVYIKVN